MSSPPLPLKRLVVIEDSTISSMAAQKPFVDEFPFLAQIHGQHLQPQGGCSACRRRAMGASRTAATANIKATLAGMGDEKKRRLKQLLNAQNVKIIYRSGNQILEQMF